MTNKEISHEIIKNKIDDNSLIVSKNKTIVPLNSLEKIGNGWSLDFVKLAIDAKAYYNGKMGLKKVPSHDLKKVLSKKNKHNIIEKHELDDSRLYIDLFHAERNLNTTIDYSDLYINYMKNCESVIDFEIMNNIFFKYMKHLHIHLVKDISELVKENYCCEEHDGPFENHERFVVQNQIREISEKLKQFTYITK